MMIRTHTERRIWRAMLGILFAVSSLIPYASKADAKNCDWQPSLSLIKSIESNLKLPNGLSLRSYERFYAGRKVNGHVVVDGKFLKSDQPSIKIVDDDELPRILDGGCSVVTLEYDVEQKKVVHLFCNGVG